MGGTVAGPRRLDPALLHEQVDGEWSFIETLRHLVFATERGSRELARRSRPGVRSSAWDEMPDTEGVPRDRDARPTLEDVLALRADQDGDGASGRRRAHR